MSKKPNFLRDALKNMRVNAPSFKAPIETQMEAPRNEVPLSQSTPNVPAQKELPKKEVAQSKAPKSEVPQREQAKDGEPTSGVPQDQAPQKEAAENGGSQNELPQIEAPEDKLSDSAFFRLSHRVFSDEKLQRMSGDCFRLFLWMASKAWRYPNSDGRVRAAIRFIEEGTGMSHANVSRCLKTLKDLGLIRVAQTDFKQGNIWWVSPLACPNGGGGGGGKGLPKKETPQFEAAQDRNGATSKRAGGSLKKNTEVPRLEGEIKKLRSIKKLKEAQTVSNITPCEPESPTDEEIETAVQSFELSESVEGQANVVTEYVARELSHGYLPPASILHRLVALDWYKSRTAIPYPAVATGV